MSWHPSHPPARPPTLPPPCRAPPHTAADQAYDVALAKLASLSEAREKFYVNADVRVPLAGVGADGDTGAPAAVIMYRLLTKVLEKIEATKAEREAKKNFTIEGLASPPVAAGGPEEIGRAHV